MMDWQKEVKIDKLNDGYNIRFDTPNARDGFLSAVRQTKGPVSDLFTHLDVGKDDAIASNPAGYR